MTTPMTHPAAIAQQAQRPASAIDIMAARCQVEPAKLYRSLADTVFKGANNEEMLALVVVANQYKLNPFLRQIYAFPKKGGGIVPIVGIDGWAAIINNQESFDGCEFSYEDGEDDGPFSCTCKMYVKGRAHPVQVTEYFDECFRETEPWKKMGRRMLRHKAFMQCGRLAFSLGGIYDEDEANDAVNAPAFEEPKMVATSKAEQIVDKIKRKVDPLESAKPAVDAPSDWAALSELGISYIAGGDVPGIVVLNEDGAVLRPDGQWQAGFGGVTVGNDGPEHDAIARGMAWKALQNETAKR